MRHLVALANHGMQQPPAAVAEFGPGLSLGAGIAAMLCGASRLHAFDAIAYTDRNQNLTVFDELVELFRNRAAIPGADEFPRVLPTLDSYEFPDRLLGNDLMERTLDPARLRSLRSLLKFEGGASGEYTIHYEAPYSIASAVNLPPIDHCFSQAVMLYVGDLEAAYRTMAGWLVVGGRMSHTLNFTALGFADAWDGHWGLTKEEWARRQSDQPYFVSRHPCSKHLKAIEAAGLSIQEVRRETAPSSQNLDRARLLAAGFDEADFTTARAFVIAQRS